MAGHSYLVYGGDSLLSTIPGREKRRKNKAAENNWTTTIGAE